MSNLSGDKGETSAGKLDNACTGSGGAEGAIGAAEAVPIELQIPDSTSPGWEKSIRKSAGR